ncbi:MAG: efflux RND transporter permease subunit, partial [Prevotella sp.]|nr:efflux RND transporter permease subunit [Prevotella sp.]
MLNRIIKLSLRNRLVVLLGAVLLLIAGLYTAKNTDVDVFPDLNAPTVVVMTEANGMAPEEVERLVTFPIETAVNGATGVRRVRSSSTTGFSVVWVEFDWGTDIYRARQIVSEKTAVVEEMLPDGVGSPTLGPQSSILGELMFVSLTADSTSLQDLRTIADWTVRPRLLATGGVAQVSVLGGEVREYQILLNPGRMRHYGVSLDEVCEAVDGMNGNVAGGILYEYGNEYIIRGVLASDNVGTLAGSLVKTTASGPVLLGNVAEVKIGNSRPKMGTASHDGKPCVMVTVTKQPNTSTVDLTAKIDTVLMELGKTLPRDVKVSSDIYRQERFINSSIDNVMKSLYEGGLFVVIVLFLFLMNVRATVISLITIPLSLLVSVLTLHLLGLTINTMSLGGMAIAIGSLVDDAIVDVENVYRRLRENSSLPPGFRQSTLTVIFNASKEVRLPILNSTLIIVASFVPLFFLSGMEGRLLVPLGIAFVTALGASTLVALTLTPVLCSYLLAGRRPGSGKLLTEPYVARKLKTAYGRLLGRALTRHRQVLAVTAVLTVVAIVGFATLGRSFLPPFNEGSFTIGVSTLPGISLEESDRIGHRVEEALLAIPEVQTVGRKTGRAELDEHALGVNDSELEVPFVLGDRSKQEVMDDIRARLAAIPGIAVEVGAPVTHRIDAMLSGTRANIAIKVFGPDLGTLYSLGKKIEEAVKDIDGIADLNVERQVERPQLRIEPRREMLARYGVTLPQFARMVGVLLGGQVVSQVYEGEKSFDLTLKVADADRMTAADIAAITVDANGAKVPLGTLANITSAMGPNTINRENVARKLVVSANVSGRDLLGVVNDIRERIDAEVAM